MLHVSKLHVSLLFLQLQTHVASSFTTNYNTLLHTESGMDYTGTMAVVIFPKSSVEGDTVCADIQILDDDALECSQNFIVSIESATLGTDIPDSQDEAVVTIEDNDGKFGIGYVVVMLILCMGKTLNVSVVWGGV